MFGWRPAWPPIFRNTGYRETTIRGGDKIKYPVLYWNCWTNGEDASRINCVSF